MLSLKLLRSFVAVAEDLHFGRAARKLGLSQPPLSQHIQALEAETGAILFVRTRRSVALTPAGRALYDEARSLLAHADRVRRVLDDSRSGVAGHLAVGCVPSALFGVLPLILRRFRRDHGAVRITLVEAHTTAILDQVADGTLDAGLAWENRPASPLQAQPVWRDSFVAALPDPNPLGAKDRLSLVDLREQPILLSPRRLTPHHYDSVIAAFAAVGVTPHIAYEPPTVLSQLGFVANGFGVAIVPPFAAATPIPGLTYRPITGLPPVELCLIWHAEPTRSSVTLLRALAPLL